MSSIIPWLLPFYLCTIKCLDDLSKHSMIIIQMNRLKYLFPNRYFQESQPPNNLISQSISPVSHAIHIIIPPYHMNDLVYMIYIACKQGHNNRAKHERRIFMSERRILKFKLCFSSLFPQKNDYFHI